MNEVLSSLSFNATFAIQIPAYQFSRAIFSVFAAVPQNYSPSFCSNGVVLLPSSVAHGLLMISFLMNLIESMLTYRAKIEEGFGPNSLGILSISDVPEYTLLRRNLLLLSPRLANLPESVKQELEDPHRRYNFGWSHGKEKLESGKPDVHHIADEIYGPIALCQNLR
ncbi:PREDICTED: uncharacterized protein LOC109172278 isoform X2 [Ipomoea nil]|uniref:uncharacterized protein LOC109172278 isoform X2 n=1 Tax=Ipomoea nil TaxID=35883 RepID=UPI000900FD71|nr:PREDICTED: uncharacterized protein LOC109172278 isoform X2 [Ipomoea nil]